jgi:teichuronic acid biosynthesis glycosyltransferase TuaC
MRVLFVVKGKSKGGEIASFILSQLESIKAKGMDISLFPVSGKGVSAYFKSHRQLRKYIIENKIDIVHAHYSLCGWTAVLARSGKPTVLSLMGSDALGEYISPNRITLKSRMVVLLTLLIQPFVEAIISKAENIHNRIYRKRIAYVIPNGIDLNSVIPGNKIEYKKELGLSTDKIYILFLGYPENNWKNLILVKKALSMLSDKRLELLIPSPVSHDYVVKYLNASDILISTSFMEGSPNVIKEAMACNCPIVTTDVGDARWVIGNTEGCFITSFDPADVAAKIKSALQFLNEKGRTTGRQRILELGLDSSTVAKRIIEVYKKVLTKSV